MTQIIDPAAVLRQLTLDEKIALLSGNDMWHTAPVPRLGVPRVRVSDGPNGIRGISMLNSAASACFPCATGTGSTFDVDLLERIGAALGAECRVRGSHCLLGPTTNIQRDPRGGRGFESFGEDPHHAGTIAAAWIKGVQSQGVMTCPKHLVCNEQELNRRSTNSVLDQRTLHEIYLEPFRLQCKENPKTFMTSYNRVNGLHASEHPHLLKEILRRDYKFDGLVMSDWGGTYSSSEAVNATLDLEMPGPGMMRGASLERDILSGKLSPEAMDACVLRVLEFVRNAQQSGIPFEAKENTLDTPEVRALLRESAAASVVLLKNSNSTLPLNLSSGQKIAVIGPNANVACYAGGGSANLSPTYTVTPLQAITSVAEKSGASVQTCIGAHTTRWTPLLNNHIETSRGEKGCLLAEFFSESPYEGRDVDCHYAMAVKGTWAFFIDGIPATVPVRGYIRVTTKFTPNETGTWIMGLVTAGQGRLYIDGQEVVENVVDQTADVTFFNTGASERLGEIQLEAGREYDLEVRFSNFQQISAKSPYAGRRGGIRIGGKLKRSPEEAIQQAVDLVKSSDTAILCIGLNGEWESESYDRDDIRLPGTTNDLVQAVLAVKPDAIIVNQSGMPVEMPWIDQALTVLQAFFGGNECGNGIADVIFGRINPSSKLPITWPRVLEDYPAHAGFGHPTDTVYSEGLSVGYRHFDRAEGPSSLFPYGHGLSYTTFSYSGLGSLWTSERELDISFTVKNTGKVAGAEVGLVFVHESTPMVWRPEIELAGFAKSPLLQPGESAVLKSRLDIKAFSYYCPSRNRWVARKGAFKIRVGPSSRQMALTTAVQLQNSWSWVGLHEPVLE